MESLGQCLKYVKGTIEVSLPAGHEGCQYCIFLRKNKDMNYFYCSRTTESILDIVNTRGDKCPVEWEE